MQRATNKVDKSNQEDIQRIGIAVVEFGTTCALFGIDEREADISSSNLYTSEAARKQISHNPVELENVMNVIDQLKALRRG